VHRLLRARRAAYSDSQAVSGADNHGSSSGGHLATEPCATTTRRDAAGKASGSAKPVVKTSAHPAPIRLPERPRLRRVEHLGIMCWRGQFRSTTVYNFYADGCYRMLVNAWIRDGSMH